jgi:hypothetical protein
MARQTLCYSRRRGGWVDAADGEAMETDDHVIDTTDIGLRAVGFLADPRVTLQELVQRGMAAVEGIDPIRCRELANRRING